MSPGWCWIAIAALEVGNGDSWCHMCAFRFHFWDRKLNWNQASHVRASSVPTLYACCLTKRSCHFLFVARVGLCCWFCDFAVSFLVPPDGPKNGTVKVLFFCSFTKQCMRSQKWDRQAVLFLGPCLGSFFEVFCIKVAEAQRFGFNEALWLMAAGRATREALLSEAGFENVFRTQNWARRRKLFCRWFCFLLGQAGCISVAAWTQLKVAFYYFVSSGGLFAAKRRRISLLQPYRWLLEVFLVVAEFVGLRAGGRLPFEWLYWILYCPLWAPLAPLDSYRSFQPRKNMNYDLFSQSRY